MKLRLKKGQKKYINMNNKIKKSTSKSFAWSLNSAHHFKHISNLSCAFFLLFSSLKCFTHFVHAV